MSVEITDEVIDTFVPPTMAAAVILGVEALIDGIPVEDVDEAVAPLADWPADYRANAVKSFGESLVKIRAWVDAVEAALPASETGE